MSWLDLIFAFAPKKSRTFRLKIAKCIQINLLKWKISAAVRDYVTIRISRWNKLSNNNWRKLLKRQPWHRKMDVHAEAIRRSTFFWTVSQWWSFARRPFKRSKRFCLLFVVVVAVDSLSNRHCSGAWNAKMIVYRAGSDIYHCIRLISLPLLPVWMKCCAHNWKSIFTL